MFSFQTPRSSGRKLAVGAATAIVAASVPAAVLVLQPSAATGSTTGTTIHLVARAGTFHNVDVAPTGGNPSPGDYFVLTTRLFRHGSRVGTLHAQCTVTKAAPKPDNTPVLCSGSYVLGAGQITGTAVLREGATRNVIAITGGTGRYTGASGTSTEVTRGNVTDVTIRLQ